MPKRIGIAIVTLGAVLILSALLLFLYNRRESYLAGQEAEILLSDVESMIAALAAEPPENAATDPTGEVSAWEVGNETAEPTLAPELPSVTIDGYDYVGYVEIAALELRLPVMAQWSYSRLKIAPCRQAGSSRTDDLVIAAHNYRSHFGKLKQLVSGDLVTFTDMDGVVNTYRVEKLEIVEAGAVDAVLNSGYDLVLYTCAAGGKTRVTVFCNRSVPLS